VVRHAPADLAFVQGDAVGFDVIEQQIGHGQGSVAIEELREPLRNDWHKLLLVCYLKKNKSAPGGRIDAGVL